MFYKGEQNVKEIPLDPMIAVSAAFIFLLIVGLAVLTTLAGLHWDLVGVAGMGSV